jgi:predicted DNA-binding transcriptional regulator AlpA
MGHEYVDERELERRLGIAGKTWRNWRAARKGPPYRKLGKRVVYLWTEVQAWIDAQKVAA